MAKKPRSGAPARGQNTEKTSLLSFTSPPPAELALGLLEQVLRKLEFADRHHKGDHYEGLLLEQVLRVLEYVDRHRKEVHYEGLRPATIRLIRWGTQLLEKQERGNRLSELVVRIEGLGDVKVSLGAAARMAEEALTRCWQAEAKLANSVPKRGMSRERVEAGQQRPEKGRPAAEPDIRPGTVPGREEPRRP
jgi:hypothetical protein